MCYTHIVGGVLVGGAAYMLVPVGDPITFLAGAVAGSLMPDLDHPNAFLNRRAKFTSPLTMFGHRGATHSLLFAFIWLGLLSVLGLWQSVVWGLFWGYLSHLILDTLNPSGVPWLWPYKRRISICKITTNSGFEYLFLMFMLGAIYLWFKTI